MSDFSRGDNPRTGKKNLSPEARERLSRLAKERHARGEFGGAKFGKLGGRPRKNRAATRVAEAAQEDQNARAIIQVFKDAIDKRQPMGTRLRGAELWLAQENAEEKLALREEEVVGEAQDRDTLLKLLAEKLTTGPAAGLVRRQIEQSSGIVDAVVVEDEEHSNGNGAASEAPESS